MIHDRFSLTGRHVLVTGAGRGLGRAMAVAAAEAGAVVTAVARTAEQLEETRSLAGAAGGTVHALPWDLGVSETLPALVDAAEGAGAGPVDSVIHAAGVQLRKPAVELTLEDWRSVQRLNAETPFFLSVEIARRRLVDQAPAGSHIFIGSLASSIGLPNVAPYVMSKSAVLGAVRTLSGEWAGKGIRVNGIAPGYVQTQLTADLLSRAEDYERVLARVPMGRIGAAEDFAGVAVFLLSNASGYITGQMLNVDGGWLAA